MPNTRVPVIQQRLKGDAESICFKCFHRKVCRATDNQPCIAHNQKRVSRACSTSGTASAEGDGESADPR